MILKFVGVISFFSVRFLVELVASPRIRDGKDDEMKRSGIGGTYRSIARFPETAPSKCKRQD